MKLGHAKLDQVDRRQRRYLVVEDRGPARRADAQHGTAGRVTERQLKRFVAFYIVIVQDWNLHLAARLAIQKVHHLGRPSEIGAVAGGEVGGG